jgi:hypothetical protein
VIILVTRLLNYLKSIIWSKPSGEKEFDERNFRETKGESSRIFSIDGGNALIGDGGTWSISKAKTAVVGYENGKRIKEDVVFNLFMLIRKNGEIILNDDIKIPEIEFNNIKFEDAPSEVRKILEFMTTIKVLDELKSGDVLLIDSLLKPDHGFQEKIIDEMIQKAEKKNVHLLGVAKTSRLSTKSGRSLIGLLSEAGMKPFPWYYYPISDEKTDFKDMVIKFHPKSKYCYRCNLIGSEIALSTATMYSNDAELVGYPYPLLRADKIARISSYEKEADRRNLSITARKMGLDKIEYDILSQDMHARLDKRMYR